MRLTFRPTVGRALDRLAKVYDCDVPALVTIAVEEMVKAHRRPRVSARPRRVVKRRRTVPRAVAPAAIVPTPAPPPAAAERVYQDKACCTCGKTFTPTGPRSLVCPSCKAEWDADVRERAKAS